MAEEKGGDKVSLRIAHSYKRRSFGRAIEEAECAECLAAQTRVRVSVDRRVLSRTKSVAESAVRELQGFLEFPETVPKLRGFGSGIMQYFVPGMIRSAIDGLQNAIALLQMSFVYVDRLEQSLEDSLRCIPLDAFEKKMESVGSLMHEALLLYECKEEIAEMSVCFCTNKVHKAFYPDGEPKNFTLMLVQEHGIDRAFEMQCEICKRIEPGYEAEKSRLVEDYRKQKEKKNESANTTFSYRRAGAPRSRPRRCPPPLRGRRSRVPR
jgi:hypothetical protein